ncbi:MAG: peptidase domain-containing ABC transporter [Microscillaceae bacterium]|jgi:ATP-binding cassette subfamily B protein|nr:peptidase domain-containing ABC transporter [Microscillaceae bacterium]
MKIKIPFLNSFIPSPGAKGFLVKQQGESDCGVACLLSIIRYFGGNQKLEYLRELSGTTAQGTTLLGLVQACPTLGLAGKGLRVNMDYLHQIKNPVILPVVIDNRLNHYVVCYPKSSPTPTLPGREGVITPPSEGVGERLLIGDPAKGIVQYTENELDSIWQSKAVLTIEPNESFVLAKTEQADKRKWLLNLLQEDWAMLSIASLIGVVLALLGLATAVFSQRLIDEILPKAQYHKLYIGLGLLTFLLLARAGLNYVRSWFLIKQSLAFNQRMIAKFYGALLHLPKPFFDTRKIGELIARMNDTKRIQNNISFIAGNVVIDSLIVLISSIFIFNYHWQIGILACLSIPFYLLLAYRFSAKIIQSQQSVMESYAYNESNYMDTIQGISTIKSLQKESFFAQITQTIYGLYQQKLFDLGKLGMRFNFWAELIGILLIISIFAFTSWAVLDKQLQIGEMMAILTTVGSLIPAVGRLATMNIQIQEAKIAFDRMYEFASLQPESPTPTLPEGGGVSYSLPFGEGRGGASASFEELEVKNLSFRFVGRKPLFQNINFSVKKGEMIALLGESGSGKSTILQILQRFYTPEKGEVLINQQNWQTISTEVWRKQVGYVPQDIKIFNGTILDNICLASPQAHFEKVVQFCQSLGILDFFQQFPQGFLTLVGEQGLNLSGGQKQFIALIRTLYHQPTLLLLDEFSSAMDKNLEKLSFDLLFQLKPTLAIILVTHQSELAGLCEYTFRLNTTMTTAIQ